MSLEKFREQQGRHSLGYGSSKGQLGNMKAGDVSLVCTSPPYAESLSSEKSGIDLSKSTFGPHSQLKTSQQYSSNPSNLGNLPAGKVENVVSGIVTSPPWEESICGGKECGIDWTKVHGSRWAQQEETYGKSPGQIGQESGNTYWEAVRDVYAECYKVLKPGGVLVVVVKSYVKAGRRVPLPMQTLKLLIRLGFEPLERIKAMLVKEEVSAGLFGEIRKVKERKSFFRRLAEKKGSPRIDFEEVLVCKRPK